eukprot:TRINITY_DN1197_c0_g2_i1.p1 TRINITY_DN1197_c0_g2~~TRINITY_DN1197_c0_g2_i1.p1  ORF type:complete len:158 (+),score=56.98 TRINITY_DN1197_c0_g2_i1:52-474(+)
MAAAVLALPVTQEAAQAWQKVRTRKHRYVIWKIENNEITLDTAGDVKDDKAKFLSELPDTHPRYTVFDYEFRTRDGRLTSKLMFISWNPLNSNQNDKILYAQQRHYFKESLNGTIHFNCNTRAEVDRILGGQEDDDSDQD